MGFGATCLLNEYEAGAIVLNLFLFCFQFSILFYILQTCFELRAFCWGKFHLGQIFQFVFMTYNMIN